MPRIVTQDAASLGAELKAGYFDMPAKILEGVSLLDLNKALGWIFDIPLDHDCGPASAPDRQPRHLNPICVNAVSHFDFGGVAAQVPVPHNLVHGILDGSATLAHVEDEVLCCGLASHSARLAEARAQATEPQRLGWREAECPEH
jgi:hypothetical protein